MGICPLCNGFSELILSCPVCQNYLQDQGRLMDVFDDYSPYMPIDLMKLEDGYPHDFKNGECPHIFLCPNCGYEQVQLIKE